MMITRITLDALGSPMIVSRRCFVIDEESKPVLNNRME